MSDYRKEFSKIYDQYVDKIYRFVFLKVKSQEIAEDLTSEVFLRGWQAFKSKNKIENIQAFLYQIARNLLVDHYRETGKARLVSAEYAPQITDPGQNLEEESLIRSDLEEIKGALAHIKEDYQEVIIWYYLDELKVPEIAKMLNKSEPTVRVLIHRALKALKNQVK